MLFITCDQAQGLTTLTGLGLLSRRLRQERQPVVAEASLYRADGTTAREDDRDGWVFAVRLNWCHSYQPLAGAAAEGNGRVIRPAGGSAAEVGAGAGEDGEEEVRGRQGAVRRQREQGASATGAASRRRQAGGEGGGRSEGEEAAAAGAGGAGARAAGRPAAARKGAPRAAAAGKKTVARRKAEAGGGAEAEGSTGGTGSGEGAAAESS
jgi:hypothetical protein